MSLVTDHLLQTVQPCPVRHIEKDGSPYLSRYFVGKWPDGRQLWLHRFHSSDGDDMLHNHAWTAHSWVVCGGYSEQVVTQEGVQVRRRQAPLAPVNQMEVLSLVRAALDGSRWVALDQIIGRAVIGPDTWHRIEWIEPETWTLLVVEPGRASHWHFADPCGHSGEPARIHDEAAFPEGWELRAIESAGEDWYQDLPTPATRPDAP